MSTTLRAAAAARRVGEAERRSRRRTGEGTDCHSAPESEEQQEKKEEKDGAPDQGCLRRTRRGAARTHAHTHQRHNPRVKRAGRRRRREEPVRERSRAAWSSRGGAELKVRGSSG